MRVGVHTVDSSYEKVKEGKTFAFSYMMFLISKRSSFQGCMKNFKRHISYNQGLSSDFTRFVRRLHWEGGGGGGVERERETERQTERDRQTDRQTDRDREKETERERETDRQTDRQRERQSQRQRERDREILLIGNDANGNIYKVIRIRH